MNTLMNKCRLCLKDNLDNNMKTLYSFITLETQNEIQLLEMYNYVTNIQLMNNTKLICKECENELIKSYKFKSLCIKSNDILNKIEPKDIEDKNSIKNEKIEECIIVSYQNETDSIAEDNTPNAEEDTPNTEQQNKTIDEKITNKKKPIKKSIKSRDRKLCPLCGKLILCHVIKRHIASHNKTKEYLCTECGKCFSLSENLKKHLRIHTNEKRYECNICGEKFIHWNSKRSHIRAVHTGEKNYKCHICGKKFAQSSNLFRHIRQHTGELPHECEFCHKKFVSSPELRNHLVTHTKEKNEICEVCTKAFGTKKALRTHLKIHTGERNYKCPICFKAFTQAHVLRSHFKTHPDCPVPPPGSILSQKALNKHPLMQSI